MGRWRWYSLMHIVTPGRMTAHGSIMAPCSRAAAEGIIDVAKSTQVGLRTYNDSDHGFEILTSPWVHRNSIDAAIDIVRERAGETPVYLSFDIDGLDRPLRRDWHASGRWACKLAGAEFIRGLEPLILLGWICRSLSLPMTMPRSRPLRQPACVSIGLP